MVSALTNGFRHLFLRYFIWSKSVFPEWEKNWRDLGQQVTALRSVQTAPEVFYSWDPLFPKSIHSIPQSMDNQRTRESHQKIKAPFLVSILDHTGEDTDLQDTHCNLAWNFGQDGMWEKGCFYPRSTLGECPQSQHMPPSLDSPTSFLRSVYEAEKSPP